MPNDNTDRLYRLYPHINSLNDCYVELYNFEEQVSVDESMILFNSHNALKQYNPLKPKKEDLWMRAGIDGCISKFSVYFE